MNSIELADVKAALRVVHNFDDALLTRLIDAAVRECLAFLNSEVLPESSSSSEAEVFIPEDVFQGIVRIVQAEYEGDITLRDKYRHAAEVMWFPYRTGLGV
jgi:hypothetical protein